MGLWVWRGIEKVNEYRMQLATEKRTDRENFGAKPKKNWLGKTGKSDARRKTWKVQWEGKLAASGEVKR